MEPDICGYSATFLENFKFQQNAHPTRSERYTARLRPPQASELAVLYHNDGGLRRDGQAVALWASAFWFVGASRAGPPAEALDAGHISDMAEYVGVQMSMEALHWAHVDRRVVFRWSPRFLRVRWSSLADENPLVGLPIYGRSSACASNSATLSRKAVFIGFISHLLRIHCIC